ncbi:MAG: MogA/MoaB family molybdenum cofactor biosynthesis protein [Acidimicrobiaceae bacterium]|nr:MogA/MoaB family molybdenum cofactor biosynthesis protein [Acidimicrobiaceae bacterium]
MSGASSGSAVKQGAGSGSGLAAKVLTVSDGVVAGTRENRSGAALTEFLASTGWTVVEQSVVADGVKPVSRELRRLADGFHGLIVTTGGTGFGPRDATPEATKAVIEREAPGLSEAMRLVNPLGRLSRGTAGVVGAALVLNTPGSTAGCVESVEAVLDVIGHAVRLLVDNYDPHPHT